MQHVKYSETKYLHGSKTCLNDFFRKLRQFRRLVLPAPEGPMMAIICKKIRVQEWDQKR